MQMLTLSLVRACMNPDKQTSNATYPTSIEHVDLHKVALLYDCGLQIM